jgi:hypothetical protein
MGFRKATPEEKKEKACEDIWVSSRGLVLAHEKINGGSGKNAGGPSENTSETCAADKLDLWCQALRDELFQYDLEYFAYLADIRDMTLTEFLETMVASGSMMR